MFGHRSKRIPTDFICVYLWKSASKIFVLKTKLVLCGFVWVVNIQALITVSADDEHALIKNLFLFFNLNSNDRPLFLPY